MDTSEFTVSAGNIVPGMVLDFETMQGVVAGEATDVAVQLGEAEVISVESPDGLDSRYGLWVSPEDGSVSEAFVPVYAWQSFKIAG